MRIDLLPTSPHLPPSPSPSPPPHSLVPFPVSGRPVGFLLPHLCQQLAPPSAVPFPASLIITICASVIFPTRPPQLCVRCHHPTDVHIMIRIRDSFRKHSAQQLHAAAATPCFLHYHDTCRNGDRRRKVFCKVGTSSPLPIPLFQCCVQTSTVHRIT